MKAPEQERIDELGILVEYWRLELALARVDTRIEAANRQYKAFSAELKSLTVRLNENLQNGTWS